MLLQFSIASISLINLALLGLLIVVEKVRMAATRVPVRVKPR